MPAWQRRRFASIGKNVTIDPRAVVLRPDLIAIGNNVRIDAFAVISATFPVFIGNHVHIAAGAKVISSGGMTVIEDFAGVSADAKIYTASDDYVGGSLTNPTVPSAYKDIDARAVTVGRHVIVGAGSVILPGVTLGFGSVVGALSLVKSDTNEGEVVAGTPARIIAQRDTHRLRLLEAQFNSKEELSGPR